jgi:hypothetical protein
MDNPRRWHGMNVSGPLAGVPPRKNWKQFYKL